MEISGHRIERRLSRRGRAEQIARQGSFQRRIAARQPAFIGIDSAIKCLRHPFHLTADAEIAGAHFAQRAVKIGEHRIDKPLTQLRRGRRLVFQAVEEQECVQTDQLEPAINRVRNTDIAEKSAPTRLIDDSAIGQFGGLLLRVAAKQRNHRG